MITDWISLVCTDISCIEKDTAKAPLSRKLLLRGGTSIEPKSSSAKKSLPEKIHHPSLSPRKDAGEKPKYAKRVRDTLPNESRKTISNENGAADKTVHCGDSQEE